MIRLGMLSVDEKTFLDEIIAAPENHEPRLVYADWLEDNGDPRGEFIRLQIERDVCQQDPTRSIERGTREEKLLEAYREQWSAPLLKLGIEKTAVGFRWGFIDAVGVSCRTAVSHMGAIRSFCPLLRRLYLHSVTDWIDQFSGSPHLNGLIQIGFRGLLTPENVQHFFFDTPRLETLKALDFGDTRIGDSGLAILLTAPQLRDIMALDLNDCNLTWRAVRQVLNWRLASQLEWLNLRHNPISDRGGKLLTRTRKLTSVKHLNLVRAQLETGLIAQLNARWGDVLHS